MDTDAAGRFLYLLQVANASFPTGAFNHSCGFETWIDRGEITGAADLEATCHDWLDYALAPGDAAIVAQARRAADAGEDEDLVALDQLAAAIKLSREAREASDKTGQALLNALRDIFDLAGFATYRRAVAEGRCEGHYPVIFGAAAAELGVAEEQAVLAYLQSSLANIVAVAARLIPLGQVEAQRIVRRSWPRLIAATERARGMDREAIGTTMADLDLASMQHERLHTRLCMS